MWRSKKFIVVAVLAAVVLVGTIGGIALAQTENGDGSQPEVCHGLLMDRICAIYEENTGVAIDQQELGDAFAQARSEMRNEIMSSHLQNLVDQGKITQDEADQYKEQWQSRADMPAKFGFGGHGGFRGHGGFHAPWDN